MDSSEKEIKIHLNYENMSIIAEYKTGDMECHKN
jgi:hypothetical protein